jgi:NAD(P)-dependent dehydrogenase (short-subunit alcohol dehydrogenase family)
MSVAVITGASRGLGRAITCALGDRGWLVVANARDLSALGHLADDQPTVLLAPGDVTDPDTRRRILAGVAHFGRLDLLVNNASALGPSPQPSLDAYPLDELQRVYDGNVFAPLALTQLLLPHLRESNGTIVNITSDAAVERYEGWGGYGSSKAALDQITNILAGEEPSLHVYAFDPGDMRTAMHQAAFPGEDISDRPEPETVLPAFLRIIGERPVSGRYRAADLAEPTLASAVAS